MLYFNRENGMAAFHPLRRSGRLAGDALSTGLPGRLSDTQRGDNMKFVSAAALALIGCLVGFNSANAQRSRYENDADDQNSRHRDHQSRF
jgi:hypothetical protein